MAVDLDEASNFYAHMQPKVWQVLGEIIGGVAIAFYYCWQVALVVCAGDQPHATLAGCAQSLILPCPALPVACLLVCLFLLLPWLWFALPPHPFSYK
jgi:hypothetical protein